MTVRRARADDAEALASVHIAAWQTAYRDIFPTAFLDGLDELARARWFERIIGGGRPVLVADTGMSVVGFCLPGQSDDPGWGEVHAIYVQPEHWGAGHGRALLTEGEGEIFAMGLTRAMLWVIEQNVRARSFYERQGWSVAKPFRIEEIGGVQVTQVRYEKDLR